MDKRVNLSRWILMLIGASPTGMSYKEITRALYDAAPPRLRNGMPYKPAPYTKSWWANQLCGSGYYGHPGLLHTYCKKDSAGRWHLVKTVPAKPWTECKHPPVKLDAQSQFLAEYRNAYSIIRELDKYEKKYPLYF